MSKLDVMVDLETLGIHAGCVVLTIGACTFDLRHQFYERISISDSRDKGFLENPDTVRWWSKQPFHVKQEAMGGIDEVLTILNKFSDWMGGLPAVRKDIQLWGNGADFDLPILAAYYKKLDLEQPWSPYSGRCYRTLKTLLPHVTAAEKNKLKHNALEDAIYQAQHAVLLLQVL